MKETTVVCDLCKVEGYPIRLQGAEWKNDGRYLEETHISYYSKINFSSGSEDNEIRAFHICPDCFKRKLIPWMQSQGANVTKGYY